MSITIQDAKTIVRGNIASMKNSRTLENELLIDVLETLMNHIDRLEKDSYVKIIKEFNRIKGEIK